MISAGRLNQKITFVNKDLSEIKTVHANVLAISSREQLRNGAEVVTDTYTVLIRYTKGISPSLLIKWQNCIYEIIGMNANHEDNSIYLTITYSARNDKNFKES